MSQPPKSTIFAPAARWVALRMVCLVIGLSSWTGSAASGADSAAPNPVAVEHPENARFCHLQTLCVPGVRWNERLIMAANATLARMNSSPTTPGLVEWLPLAETGENVLRFTGDWTLQHFAALEAQLDALKPGLPECPDVDFNDVGRIDTSGAGLIAVALGPKALQWLAEHDRDVPHELRGLLDTVSEAVAEIYAHRPPPPRDSVHRGSCFLRLPARTRRDAHRDHPGRPHRQRIHRADRFDESQRGN